MVPLCRKEEGVQDQLETNCGGIDGSLQVKVGSIRIRTAIFESNIRTTRIRTPKLVKTSIYNTINSFIIICKWHKTANVPFFPVEKQQQEGVRDVLCYLRSDQILKIKLSPVLDNKRSIFSHGRTIVMYTRGVMIDY